MILYDIMIMTKQKFETDVLRRRNVTPGVAVCLQIMVLQMQKKEKSVALSRLDKRFCVVNK